MKRFLILFCMLQNMFVFSYDYESESFVIKENSASSKINGDKAVIDGKVLKSVADMDERQAILSADAGPSVQLNDPILDFLTKMAYQEVKLNVNKDGVFSAGANWPTAWTRDMSYAIDLSLGFLFPEVVEKSLLSRVENGLIVQDTGSGGSYPVSTDRVVWGIAADSYAIFKNDIEYKKWVYEVLSKTLEYDLKVSYDEDIGLFKGETSFIDWREQSYPRWMDCNYIGSSFSFGTNVVYYGAIKRCARLAFEFGKNDDVERWSDLAGKLKESINKNFWMESESHYGMYLINQLYPRLHGAYENLGASLAVLEGVSDAVGSEKLLMSLKEGKWGSSVFAPQLGGVPSYHNDGVWPFVQGYRILAAKRAKLMDVAEKEFASMIYSAMMFGTFKENQVATAFSSETQTNSDRQLWSDAAWLSNIYRVIFGLDFKSNGISIEPCIFKSLSSGVSLKNFKIGNSTLNLLVEGAGNEIEYANVNGIISSDPVFLPYADGQTWNVTIKMKAKSENALLKQSHTAFCDEIAPQIPNVSYDFDGKLGYIKIRTKGESKLVLLKNGIVCDWYKGQKAFEVKPGVDMDVYQVFALPADAEINDFRSYSKYLPSDQIRVETNKNTFFVEAEKSSFEGGSIKKDDSGEKPAKLSSDLQQSIANGNSYIEKWGEEESNFIEFTVKVTKAGKYSVDFRYQNGNGPVNTGYKCALSSLEVNGKKLGGKILFAQIGNWSAWKFSSNRIIELKKGVNSIKISKDAYCRTSKNLLNPINIDLMRISKLSD